MPDDVRPTPAQERAAANQGLEYGMVDIGDVQRYVHIPEDNPANRSPSVPQAANKVNGLGRPYQEIACFTCGRPARTDHAMSSFLWLRGEIYCGWCSPKCEVHYHRAWRSNLILGGFTDGETPI